MPHQAVCTKMFFVLSALSCALLPIKAYAQAQESATEVDLCAVNYEMVTALTHQEAGAYLMWQTPVGHKTAHDKLRAAYFDGAGHFDSLGVSVIENKKHLFLGEFDMETGRAQNETIIAFPELDDVIASFSGANGKTLVFANVEVSKNKKAISIGVISEEKKYKQTTLIKDADYDLVLRSVIRSMDGEGWVLSVSSGREYAIGNKSDYRENAVLYFLNDKLNVTSSRGYVLGQRNEILNLSVLKSDDDRPGYIATGYYKNADSGAYGWVMRLDAEGSVVWQEEFRRGESAKMRFGTQAGNDAIYVLGDVSSTIEALKGVWLMALDLQGGKPISHRFFYAQNRVYDYHAKGMYLLEDGRLVLLLSTHVLEDANNIGEKSGEIFLDGYGDDYARVVLLDPRGNILSGASYFYEKGIELSGMMIGDGGQTVIYGAALRPSYSLRDKRLKENHVLDPNVKEPLKEYGELYDLDADTSANSQSGLAMLKDKMQAHGKGAMPKKESAKSDDDSISENYDGWVLVAEPWDVYEDPCVEKKR